MKNEMAKEVVAGKMKKADAPEGTKPTSQRTVEQSVAKLELFH